jgi:hypothetical protein
MFIKISIFLIFSAVILVGLMFAFKICPPKGPWPTPPWCADKAFIRPTYNLNLEVSHLNQKKAVNMADTWGRNYNFGMIENTRDNIDNSFDRVKEIGAEEVYVHDFHRAVYDDSSKEDFTSLNYKIVDEIFLNDMRDESLTDKDVASLAEAAHQRGLKLGIKHNMAFVDIGKYLVKGLSGNIESSVNEDYKKFNSGHSEEWIRDFFVKWEARMIERAKIYNKYGVDIMSITPTWMGPTFSGQEALANELWKKLITDLRKEFKGQIHLELSVYGILDPTNAEEDYSKYDYYKSADIKEVRLYNFSIDKYKVKNNPTSLDIQKGMSNLLVDLNSWGAQNNTKLTIFFSPFSYPNAINQGIIEYHDILNETTKTTEKNYEHQADAWQGFFLGIKELNNLEGIIASGMWWDDEMDPDVKVKISISPSFRNKPAEEVIKQWFQK